MPIRDRLDEWYDQVREEPVRHCGWPRMQRLAAIVMMLLLAGLFAKAAAGALKVAWSLAALVFAALLRRGLDRWLYITRAPAK